jgi:hypothetical protein
MIREALDISDSAAWHGWRSRDLTASRIAALFDQHPFLSREGLAAQLRGGARRRPVDLTPAAERAMLEAAAAWWEALGRGEIAEAAPIDGLADQVDAVAPSSRRAARAVVRTWTDGLDRRIDGERPAA